MSGLYEASLQDSTMMEYSLNIYHYINIIHKLRILQSYSTLISGIYLSGPLNH